MLISLRAILFVFSKIDNQFYFLIKKFQRTHWCLLLVYFKKSWQKKLYKHRYGKYVLKFEYIDVTSWNDFKKLNTKDYENVGLYGFSLNKFKKKMRLDSKKNKRASYSHNG